MIRGLRSILSLAAAAAAAGCGGSAVVTASAGGTGAGPAKPSTGRYASTPASGGQVNPRAVPLGDGYISTTPRVGYVDSCMTRFGGGGAQANGPWIDSSTRTWNSLAKIAVRGAVRWPSAYYRVTVSGGRRVIQSDDLPVNHTTGTFPISSSDPAYRYDRNPNRISAHSFTWSLPLHPVAAAHPSCTGGGPIGVLSDGVVLFNALDGEGRDAGVHEGLDRCGAHPDQSGTYHHHFIPPCIVNRAPNGRSTLIGYALDGFGIYVEKGARGALPGNRGLDACHGKTSRVPWQGRILRIYHYVATLEYPYSIACFRGTPLRTGVAG